MFLKKLLLNLILSLALIQSQAQQSVSFSGQIKNAKADESIYLGLEGMLIQLKLQDSGAFSINTSLQQLPACFYIASITKKGKIEQHTPRIWFEKDSIGINIDWVDKSFQVADKMSYQSISEKIESLKGSQQNQFILSNSVNIPILYFANENKNDIPVPDLEIFSQKVDKLYQGSTYFKKIEAYINAKKRKPLKIGDIVQDFTLPDRDGNPISIINGSEKIKLVAFFSSGCSFSISSIGLLEQLEKINNSKIQIISVWADDTKYSWLNEHLDQKHKISWINIWDEYQFASTYFNNTGWPTFYVINAEAKLIDIFHDYNQKTANKLKELVK